LTTKILTKLNISKNKKDEPEIKKIIDSLEKEKETFPIIEKSMDNFSFRDYLRSTGQVISEDSGTYVKQNKTIKLSFKNFSEYARNYYNKSGIKKKIFLTIMKKKKNFHW